MSEPPDEGDESNQLPAERLCNRKNMGKQNCPPVISGDGALGNQRTGRMYYSGKGKDGKDDKKKLVEILQRMLKTLGYDLGTTGPEGDGVDGKFGDLTEDAVKKFQEGHKDWDGEPLKVDGLVGPRTSDALNRAMVGKWYRHYQTPEKLVEGRPDHTATVDFLRDGLPINASGAEKARVMLVGRIPASTHASAEFMILFPALGLPEVVVGGAIDVILLLKRGSWILSRGAGEEDWREVKYALADQLRYADWENKDSESVQISINPEQLTGLSWLEVTYRGNDGKISYQDGSRRRELIAAKHVLDHLANGAGFEVAKVLRVRIELAGLGERLYNLSNKRDESEYARLALRDVAVPGNTPRDLRSEMRTLHSGLPVRRYHPFFLSNKNCLDLGHVTDVHVSTRHELYERILNGRIPQWNNFNRSFEEIMNGISELADLILLTGDLIDYNRGHKIDLSRNDGNVYQNERDFVRDYIFNRNWVLFYELLLRNYRRPMLTILGNHEYLLNPYSTNTRIGITFANVPLTSESMSFAADMNLTEGETSFEPAAEFNVSISDALNIKEYMREHNEDAIAPLLREHARELLENRERGFWYTDRESATWYFLIINPFKDYWFTYNSMSILMLDWNVRQNEGSLLLLPRPTDCISQDQFGLIDRWLTQDVGTFIFCSHAPVCDPWEDLGNFYLEMGIIKRDQDETDDYEAKRTDLYSRELNLGTIEESSRRRFLSDYIFSSQSRIYIALSGHSHTNRMFQLVNESGAKRMLLRREDRPGSWDLGSPFIIVTNSGGNTGRSNQVAEWMDLWLPGYRLLRFAESGRLRPENQIFFVNRIRIRDEVQTDAVKNDPNSAVLRKHEIQRFPPPSGAPSFSSSVTLDPDRSAVIDLVADSSVINDLNDGRAIVIKRIDQRGMLSIGNNDGTIVIEENYGRLVINDNDDLINVDHNYGLITINQNDDTILIRSNHGTIDVVSNGAGSPGTDMVKLFDNHGIMNINRPRGNEDLILVKRNYGDGTLNINYNNDTVNVAFNNGVLNINSNEGGPLEVDSTINILHNSAGNINVRNNSGEVNINGAEWGSVNRLENSGEVNHRTAQWLIEHYRFD